MASYWLLTHAPVSIKQIELLFPVQGHTFLPCDRVFKTLEKKLRKIIYSPEEYYNVFSLQRTVEIVEFLFLFFIRIKNKMSYKYNSIDFYF